jgi:hypothetical protein
MRSITLAGAVASIALAGALAVPAVAGGAVRSFVSTRCSVAPGASSRLDSATGPVSFNYPHFGGPTAAYADAAAHALGGYSGATASAAGTSDDCTTDALFRDTLTVGAGTTGLSPGAPVTLRLDVDLTGDVDGNDSTPNVPFLGSVDASASYKLSGTQLVCGGEGCEFPEFASLVFNLDRDMDWSLASLFDPDGSITDSLRWSWELTSNAGPSQGDSANDYAVVCPTFPSTCAGPGGLPLGIQLFHVPVGTRSIEFQTTVGAVIEIEGRLNILSQAYGPGYAFGDLLHSLHTGISPAAGYEGVALSYESRPVAPPKDTTAPSIECAKPDGAWHGGNVSISCVASDAESGLQDAGDAAFTLSTNVADGTEEAGAQTGTHQVCDVAGNCATAGPIGPIKVDRKAPTLTMPTNVIAEAIQPGVAEVTVVAATATDGGSGVQSVVCPTGTFKFPLGTTNVICVATDAVGNTSEAHYSVTVRDTKPPSLSLPANITVNATSPAGAAVSYTVSATDGADPNPTLSCSTPSGSGFPIGQWTVTCVATDQSGNSSTGSFTVKVKGAKEQLADLIQKVINTSSLSPAAKTLLIGKLNQLLASFDPTNPAQKQAVCLALQIFKEAVQLQAGKTITQAQAAAWIADANRIRAVLGC